MPWQDVDALPSTLLVEKKGAMPSAREKAESCAFNTRPGWLLAGARENWLLRYANPACGVASRSHYAKKRDSPAPHYAARSALLPSEPSADEPADYAPREDWVPSEVENSCQPKSTPEILARAVVPTDAPRPKSEDCVVRITDRVTAHDVRADAQSFARTSNSTITLKNELAFVSQRLPRSIRPHEYRQKRIYLRIKYRGIQT
jgi:hypothetical protein